MNDSKLAYISVIITAYNRKDFLLNAIKSVLNQTLDKKYYEIIVINNFRDKNIDDFIIENNIKYTLIEGTKGEFLYKGISLTNGEILLFLDDDDLFTEDKLEVVSKNFKANNNTVYFHNSYITVNEKYKKINSNVENNISFNMSSISVRKPVYNLDNLRKINFAPDVFMYLSALETDKIIINSSEKLTYYMRHNSASKIDTSDINEFIKFQLAGKEVDIKEFIMLSEMFNSNKANNYIRQRIAEMEIFAYIFGKNKKPKNALNIFRKCDIPVSVRLKIYIAYILIIFHHDFRDIIIKKLFDNNKKL